MKHAEPQTKLSRIKLYFYIAALLVAFTLFILASRNKLFNIERQSNLMVSVMTTLFVVAGVELIPEVVRWISDYARRGKFGKFFGPAVFTEDIRLVFARRTLAEDLDGTPFVTHYNAPTDTQSRRPAPEKVNGWLAFQDVRAAVYITNTIAEMTNKQIYAVHDKDVESDPKHFCIISFGLGFNAFTHYALGYLNPGFFEIKWGCSPKDPTLYTDYFQLHGEFPTIPARKDIGFVFRIVPKQERGRPKRVWFVCAGRTAPGTAAAGYYLANSWETMLSLYKIHGKDVDKDSLFVLIQHNEDSSGGMAKPEFTYDESAQQMGIEDNQPIVRWCRAPGVE